MYFVYILFSQGHKRFYIGQTNDLVDRIRRHNAGLEKATSPFLSWELVCHIEKKTRSEAMILEKKMKNLNAEDLRKLILNRFR